VISTFTPPAHSEGMRPGTSSGPLHAPVPMPNGRRSEPPPLLMSLKSGPSKSARTPSCTKINHRHIGPLRTAERYAAGRPGLCGADNSKGTDYPELPSEVWHNLSRNLDAHWPRSNTAAVAINQFPAKRQSQLSCSPSAVRTAE